MIGEKHKDRSYTSCCKTEARELTTRQFYIMISKHLGKDLLLCANFHVLPHHILYNTPKLAP